jgi:hypothetical protein
MSLTNVKKKLDNIEKLAGKNDKRALLKAYLNDPLFAKCMQYMFSEQATYNIKEIPETATYYKKIQAEDLFKFLDKMSAQRGATDLDKMDLAKMIGPGETREVIKRIVTGKSGAGFSVRSINKVKPNFIHQTPYQRCSTSKNLNRVKYPAMVQCKADGAFAYLHNGNFISRKGKIIAKSYNNVPAGQTLVGELLIQEQKELFARKKGNGLINKLMKSGKLDGNYRLIYKVWDMIPDVDYLLCECDIPVGERFKNLVEAVHFTETLQLVDHATIENEAEGLDFYKKMRAQGEEGAIIKNLNSTWKNNTASDMVKLKSFKEAEFEITGFKAGQNKYEGLIGSLEVKSKDDLIQCNVGTGLTDGDREYGRWAVGDIVTIKFESVISSRDRSTHDSLFLPVLIEKRFDKTEADTSDYVRQLR